MKRYLSYGSWPQKRRCSRAIASRSFAASRAVEDAGLALVDEVMFLAVDRELVHRGISEEDRRVHERVEVGRAKAMRPARHLRQSGERTLPSLRRVDGDVVRSRHPVGQRHERRRAVDQRKAGIDPVRAHAHLAAVDAILHRDGSRTACRDTPAVLVGLLDGARAAVRARCRHRLDVPLVLAQPGTSPASTPPSSTPRWRGRRWGRRPTLRRSASAAPESSTCNGSVRLSSVRAQERHVS